MLSPTAATLVVADKPWTIVVDVTCLSPCVSVGKLGSCPICCSGEGGLGCMQARKPLGEHLRAFPGVTRRGWFCFGRLSVGVLDLYSVK